MPLFSCMPDQLIEVIDDTSPVNGLPRERCFNALLGITRKDDNRRGTRRGEKDPITHPGMLDEYYHYRGCSSEGLPTRKRLQEVGLSDVIEDLSQAGKLSEAESPAIEDLLAPKETE